MNTEVLKKVQQKYTSKKVPVIKPGYTIEIETIIREGNKQRVQKFKGLVIAMNGTGTETMIQIRKISYGVGVEKKLPLYSPNIGKIKVIKTEPVRRSKLFFMRDRVGKAAMRIKKGKAVFVPEEGEVIDESKVEVVQNVESKPAEGAETK
jgi:large subunit ribosomal protein L19